MSHVAQKCGRVSGACGRRGRVVEHGYAMGSGRGFLWRNVIMTACLARGPYRKSEGVIANNSSFEWIPSFL